MVTHKVRTEPQPIADQVMASCSCGWRQAVSAWNVNEPAKFARQLCEEHLVRESGQ